MVGNIPGGNFLGWNFLGEGGFNREEFVWWEYSGWEFSWYHLKDELCVLSWVWMFSVTNQLKDFFSRPYLQRGPWPPILRYPKLPFELLWRFAISAYTGNHWNSPKLAFLAILISQIVVGTRNPCIAVTKESLNR